MAFADQESPTYADQTDEPLQSAKGAAGLEMFESETYTHAAGAGTGEINLCVLPAGEIVVFPALSYVVSSQYAANSDVHVGFRAYVDPSTGSTVSEDDNAFADNLDAGGGALNIVMSTTGALQFNTPAGLHVYSLVDTGNIEDDDTLKVYIAYKQGKLA